MFPRRRTRVLPILAFCLLAWAATAHAECAWMLWATQKVAENGGPFGPSSLSLMAAYPTVEGCTAWLDSIQSNSSAYDSRVAPTTLDRWIKEGKGEWNGKLTHIKWQCLPEGVKPTR
jgi:hypothetical protein